MAEDGRSMGSIFRTLVPLGGEQVGEGGEAQDRMVAWRSDAWAVGWGGSESSVKPAARFCGALSGCKGLSGEVRSV